MPTHLTCRHIGTRPTDPRGNSCKASRLCASSCSNSRKPSANSVCLRGWSHHEKPRGPWSHRLLQMKSSHTHNTKPRFLASDSGWRESDGLGWPAKLPPHVRLPCFLSTNPSQDRHFSRSLGLKTWTSGEKNTSSN